MSLNKLRRDGEVDSTPHGTPISWYENADTAFRQVTEDKPLPVSGSLTANIEGDYVDDSAFTVGTDSGLAIGGVFTTDTVDSGDFGAFAIDASRRQLVSLEVDNVGLSTSANQSTIIGHVDGIEGLLTTIDADTSNLSVVGGGTEAAAIRVTLANDSTGLLSIDDNGGSITVDGTVTANLSATDNAVLDSIDAAVNGTLTVGSHNVTNAGTFAVQEDGAALTSLQLIDDIVYTDDTSTHSTGTSKGAGIMAVATPTDGSIDANDIGMIAMSTDRRLLTDTQIVGQDADVTIADGGNSITVDSADLSTLAGTVSGSEIQVDVVTMPTVNIESDGTALSNGQITVDTTVGGTQIIASSAGRQGIIITNQGSVACYIGTGTVSASNGFLLNPGESVPIPSDSEIKAITSSSTTTIGFLAYA